MVLADDNEFELAASVTADIEVTLNWSARSDQLKPTRGADANSGPVGSRNRILSVPLTAASARPYVIVTRSALALPRLLRGRAAVPAEARRDRVACQSVDEVEMVQHHIDVVDDRFIETLRKIDLDPYRQRSTRERHGACHRATADTAVERDCAEMPALHVSHNPNSDWRVSSEGSALI